MSLEPQLDTPAPLDFKSPSPDPKVPKSRWKRIAKWLLFILVVVVILVFTWRHFHAKPGAWQGKKQSRHGGLSAGQTMPVQTVTLQSGDFNVYIDALGNVLPKSSVTVQPRVSGELMSVNFTEGQVVKKGDLLVQIDPRPYQVVLTQAEGQMAKDRAALLSAQQDLTRYQSLIKSGSVSKQQLDDQVALVAQSQGALKSDQGQVDAAKLNLIYCRITAPVSGKLGLRLVDPGNIVSTSTTSGIVVINQFQPIDVTYAVPEDQIQSVLKQVNAGNTLQVSALDRTAKTVLDSGKLLSLDNQIDPTTGTLKFKAEFPNAANTLYPNQFVNIHMLVETQHNVTLLPSAAIQRGTMGTYVYVVNADSTVTARAVTLGAVDGDNTAVISGVNAGQQVVFDGADKLKDGAKVRMIDPKTVAAMTATVPASHGGHHHRHHRSAS